MNYNIHYKKLCIFHTLQSQNHLTDASKTFYILQV